MANNSDADSAISYEALLEFAQKLPSNNPDISTEDVVSQVLLPLTKIQGCSYANILLSNQVSVPTFLVSHNTSSKFSLILDALKHHLDGADPADVYLWIDIFALNQHARSDATKQDLDNLESLIHSASGGTLLVLDLQGSQITRSWCLFEVWSTLRQRGSEALHLLTPGFTLKDAGAAFMVVDVRQSTARVSPDRTKILDRISGPDGKGHRELNMQVKLLYVLSPQDHKDSMQRLLHSWRFGVLMQRNLAKWMDKYMNWLDLPTSHPNYKCFAVYGPPGSGKSVLSAGMCTITTDKLDLRPHAWHFASSFNMNRWSTIGMLKTMAYQLANRIPETQTYYLNLDPNKVSKINQVEVAFNMLLRIPLARLAREGKAPAHGVIFLMDGIDEAHQPGRAGSTMPELTNYLRDLFPALPTFCRMVVNCRTESEMPHIVQSIRNKLSPMEVSPRDLLPREDMLLAMELQLNGALESHASSSDVAARILRRGFDNLLYAAIILKGMHACDSHLWSMEELGHLPADLPQAYCALFAGFLNPLAPAERALVTCLLQVLAAAREPPSLAQVQSMGLKGALKLLPGWNTLFYISNFKVHMFHKTLLDWLYRMDPTLVIAGKTEPWSSPKPFDSPAHPVAAAPAAAASSPLAPPASARHLKKGVSVKKVETQEAEGDRGKRSSTAKDGGASVTGTPDAAADSQKRVSLFKEGGGPGAESQRRGSAFKEGAGPGAESQRRGSIPKEGHAAASELQRRQAAADDVAMRLAGLLGDQPVKLMMTTETACTCELVLDVAEGHAAIADLLLEDIKSGTPHDFSLKHAVAHLCMANNVQLLEELILDFDFWENVYAAGFGFMVLKDLLEMMPEDSAIAMDVGRWLRGVHLTLAQQPKAVLQLATDAPRSSHTSKAAMRFHRQPDGVLVNKEAHWSSNLMVLSEPSSGKITSLAISPDGLRVAGGSTSKNVRLWDIKTGSPAGVLEGPSSVFNCVAYFLDGSKLASGSADKTVRIWDAKTGETAAVLEGHKDNVTSVCISADMSKLASGSADKTIRLWDLKLMEEMVVLEGHRDTVYGVSFTSDGLKVASGSGDRTVRLWDVKGKKLLFSMDGHFGVIYSVCCSPAGAHIASASSDKTIRIWDIELGQQVAVLEGHQAGVTAIAYNSTGSALASCSSDKSFRVWDPKQFQQLLCIERQVGTFNSICFSQDGAFLLTASSDKTLRQWDSKTGEELALLEGHMDAVVSVAAAGDNVRAASASLDKTVRTWDLKVEEQVAVFKGQSGVFSSVCFSPDGRFLATGSDDRSVRLWDAKTCQQVAVSEGHTESVHAVAFSPDNQLVASGSDDHTVKLWEVPSGAPVYTANQILISTGTVRCLAFSPDGSKIATGASDTYKTVRQWDVQSGKQITESKGHFGVVNAVAYSPNGSKIASGASDRTVRIWDATSGQVLQVLDGHEQAVTALAFCGLTSRVLSGGDDNSVRLWEFVGKSWAQTALLSGHMSGVTGLAFHPDGSKVCSSATSTIRVWNIPKPAAAPAAAPARMSQAGGKFGAASLRRKSLNGGPAAAADDAPTPTPGHSGMINSIAFSPNGLTLATASYDKTIRLWDSGSGSVLLVLKGHSGVVNTVVWAPCGNKLASGGADETVRVWDARTGVELHTLQGHTNWVRTVCFSPNSNKIISGSDAGDVRLWDAKSGQALGTLSGHTGWVRAVAWSPDDARMASCSEDRSIRLWDSRHQRLTHALEGHGDAVVCIAFSSNGAFLASGSEDKSVRLWSAASGRCMAELRGHYGVVTNVRFSPDCSMVSSSCADKVFRVWCTKTFKELKVLSPCTDGMWSKDLLLTVATDTGVMNLWDGRNLVPLAEAYSTSKIRDISFNGMMVACTVVGLGPDNVAVYRLNPLPPRSPHALSPTAAGPPPQCGHGQVCGGQPPPSPGHVDVRASGTMSASAASSGSPKKAATSTSPGRRAPGIGRNTSPSRTAAAAATLKPKPRTEHRAKSPPRATLPGRTR